MKVKISRIMDSTIGNELEFAVDELDNVVAETDKTSLGKRDEKGARCWQLSVMSNIVSVIFSHT